jgi:CheY-like chemotaxis protein
MFYCVTAVSCPMRALEFDVTKLHQAVLDFAMPALDGFQLLLRLRAAQASFPIVLLSSMSRDVPDDMRRVFSSCLDKGEPIDLLLNTVRSYLTAIPDPPECGVMSSRTHCHYERPSHRTHSALQKNLMLRGH